MTRRGWIIWALLLTCLFTFLIRSSAHSDVERLENIKWVDLPGNGAPALIRFYDRERNVICYYIPSSYTGLGFTYSAAISCLKDDE